MTEEEASVNYWSVLSSLEEIINSGHRGSKQDILDELEGDLTA